MPGRVAGRAPHINARVAAPGGKATVVTMLFLSSADATKDPLFKPALALKIDAGRDGKSATFKFLLDL